MTDELMYIPIDDTQKYPNQLKFIKKSPKLLSQWIRKRYYKTLRTNVMSPLSLFSYERSVLYNTLYLIKYLWMVKELNFYIQEGRGQ